MITIRTHIRIYAMLLYAFCATCCMAQNTYETTKAKADRFFTYREWASAAATYNFLLKEKPDVPGTYGRAIVAYEMLGDSIRSMELLDQAMNNGVPLDSVLINVRDRSFQIGQGHLYEHFMLSAASTHSWLERPLDAYLLKYYAFRRNGPQMVAYADKMLRGTPRSVPFLLTLADGYMLNNQYAEAIDTWKQIIEIQPDNYTAILNLANLYDMKAQYATALEYFRKAADIRRTPYVDNAISRLSRHK